MNEGREEEGTLEGMIIPEASVNVEISRENAECDTQLRFNHTQSPYKVQQPQKLECYDRRPRSRNESRRSRGFGA